MLKEISGFMKPNGDLWWHTACCMQVKTDAGTELHILDPSGLTPVSPNKIPLRTLEEWLAEQAFSDFIATRLTPPPDPLGNSSSESKVSLDMYQKQALKQNGEPVSYQFIPFEEWKNLMAEERKKYPQDPASSMNCFPANQLYVFTTKGRNWLGNPDLK